jgi:hypothetical protein
VGVCGPEFSRKNRLLVWIASSMAPGRNFLLRQSACGLVASTTTPRDTRSLEHLVWAADKTSYLARIVYTDFRTRPPLRISYGDYKDTLYAILRLIPLRYTGLDRPTPRTCCGSDPPAVTRDQNGARSFPRLEWQPPWRVQAS